MNISTLSQLQFAITCVYHFIFVPLTLGLSILIAIMETLYVRTSDKVYKHMTKFWGKLFLINFAMGVVTGIVMEFQFGMNWATYSRFVGDVFGVPLAIEALLAFFLESTFLGIWIFGWDKIPKVFHALSIWMVALAANISAFWILTANSFMQHPVGYIIENGRAEMIDFFALLKNPYVWGQFPHTVFSGFTTGAFFVMGISAYHLLRQKTRNDELDFNIFQRSMRMASIFGLISIISIIGIGDIQAKRMIQFQPMKMAAAEALMENQNPASLSFFTITDEQNLKNIVDIRIPYALSFLSFSRFDGEVKGIHTLQHQYEILYGPGRYVPSIFMTYWSFRIMVGIGLLMLIIAGYMMYLTVSKRPLLESIKFQKITIPLHNIIPFIIILPYLSNTAGWIMTEIGRQPWVVYGLMKTANAVTPTLTPGMVLISLIGFAIIYGLLIIADGYLLLKFAKAGPDHKTKSVSGTLDPELGV